MSTVTVEHRPLKWVVLNISREEAEEVGYDISSLDREDQGFGLEGIRLNFDPESDDLISAAVFIAQKLLALGHPKDDCTLTGDQETEVHGDFCRTRFQLADAVLEVASLRHHARHGDVWVAAEFPAAAERVSALFAEFKAMAAERGLDTF